MDEFPDEFNRATCNKILQVKQNELIKQVRVDFYNKATECLNKCEKTISLNFPENLWYENRAIITAEILKRFGEVSCVTLQNEFRMTKMTNDISKIPKNLKKVIIEF